MSQVIGQRSTYQTNAETRIVRQIDGDIGQLEPDTAPLITMLMSLKKRKAVKASKIEWMEDDYVTRWAQNSNNTYNSSVTSMDVVDGTAFVAGDLFQVPKLVDDATAPEIVRVTAVSTNTLTIVRNVGGGAAASIPANVPLRILGPAYEEGAAVPESKSTAPSTLTTYLQIFRTAIKHTWTEAATETYGAAKGERAREHEKKLKEHKQKMNAALLFGRPSESLTGGPTGNPIRTTMGIISAIQTNVTDAGGTMTRKTFEAFSRQSFRYGPSQKILLASPIVKSAINEWAKSFLLIEPSEKKFGVNVNMVETAHGKWMLVNDWMLESQSGYGYAGKALSLDLDQFEYLYLDNNGINRDTKLRQDVVQDGADRVIDDILTEGGYKIKQEKYHSHMYNVSDYQE